MKNNRHKKTPSLAGDGALVNEINFEEEIVMSDTSIAASNVIPFNFGKQRVRTLLVDGDPWFSVQDILRSLDYTDSYKPARAAAHVPDQWKGVHRLHTPGGTQQMLMLSEQGLYFFLGRSDKPKALPFQMWIAGEVLPDIRRTGRYEDHGKMTTLMDELIGMSELNVIKGLIRDKSKAVPADQRQGFQLVMHNRLHTRFNVPRTELIPAAQFDQACNFIGGYALEGEYLPKGGNQSVDIPSDLSEIQRYLVFTDGSGKHQVQAVPFDACVMSPTQFLAAVTGSNGLHMPPAALFDFALAAMEKVKWRVAA
ncbi:BRO-N domain-containing protein [Pseudomonas reactans]|uniref:BRO-N domain-containing protein n=1 Tax=Pseudomonas reactans TaxID=117680 RepID=UPI0015A377F4|nr:Bro-N domain-containing protein [Pseudomonas reactans]NWA68013.1 Bro-N domain-containing protein [Pseudomonas reactans]